jgi:hypothetical protein
MKDYLNTSFQKSLKERKEYYLYDIPMYIINNFPDSIDVQYLLEELKDVIPYEFMAGLDGIYVGDFPDFKERDIQAVLKDNAIYLSNFANEKDIDEEKIIKHIVHEVAHFQEDKNYYEIYGDESIEKEYIGKKKRLLSILRANGLSFPGMGKLFFSEDYVDELDDFLFKNLGYENLSQITPGLFLSPYSVTSIREYFATGFEEYLNGDKTYLKEICPQLYNKIKSFLEY